MDDLRRQPAQLRHPAAHIRPIRIVLCTLRCRVEHTKVWLGVRPGASRPLPATVIGSQIAIEQLLHEGDIPFAPVDQQMLGQEARDDHPAPVVHPAERVHLAHRCIHHRITGLSLAPPGQRLVVSKPRHALELRPVAHVEHPRVEMQDMRIELAPCQLAHPRIHRLLSGGGTRTGARDISRRQALAHRQHAKSDVRRKVRRALRRTQQRGTAIKRIRDQPIARVRVLQQRPRRKGRQPALRWGASSRDRQLHACAGHHIFQRRRWRSGDAQQPSTHLHRARHRHRHS